LYTLGSSLYINLTSRTLGTALISSRGPSFTMPPASNFQPLPPSFDPELDDLLSDLHTYLKAAQQPPAAIIFAGSGEPLLRLPEICALSKTIPETIPLRVHTNGLFVAPAPILQTLLDHRITAITVALNTHEAAIYNDIMFPNATHIILTPSLPNPFATVSNFIRTAARLDFEVTATCVLSPNVDPAKTEAYAKELSPKVAFKTRSYNP